MGIYHEYIIVGAGFSGLCMAIRLQAAGMDDFLILERNDALGGTWYDNAYPGAACDVESHLYSFSFEPNAAWSRQFSPQQEILQYMEHCTDKYHLRSKIQLNINVTGAVFDEASALWQVTTEAGHAFSARFIISCSGGLSQPAYPHIEGIGSFAGKMFHSARWDQDYDISGRKVAVIGTGASAIQIVPAIVDSVQELVLFQRTPPWVIPKPDKPISAFRRGMYKRFAFMRALYRFRLYWMHELTAIGFVVNTGLLRLFTKIAARFIRKSVKDEALRAKVTPKYVIGCKRILLSNDYYPALQKPNVSVVVDGIKEINAKGILTRDGVQHDVDAIILATGFQASENVSRFAVRGLAGLDLNESWRNGAEAYLGTSVAGFPNMFLVVGPNTGLGHSSMILMIEAQVNYIMQALQEVQKQKARYVVVKKEAQQKFNEVLQADLARSIWQSGGCHSWYQTKDGKNVTLWPGFTFTFMKKTKRFELEKYDVSL
ncbi:MAG: 4-hydroxyacetophenone monooxygenase [Bacteroidetes bacterium]|nr:4-hydroxyacetophenone monooxygenase [Bacteroidota bacterium]